MSLLVQHLHKEQYVNKYQLIGPHYVKLFIFYEHKLKMTLVISSFLFCFLNLISPLIKDFFHKTVMVWEHNSFPKCDILMFHNYKAIPSHETLFHQIA